MRLVFVTDRKDAHAARFAALFGDIHQPFSTVLVEHGDSGVVATSDLGQWTGWDQISAALGATPTVVVSGPLDSVSSHLLNGDYRHVAISWATDVMVSAARSGAELEALQGVAESVDVLVTDNYATENALIALGATPESVLRVPWGPEVSSLQQSAVRKDFGVPDDALVLLYPRSVEAHYQPEVFVAALRRLVVDHPSVVAVMVESGSQVAAIKELIAAWGIDEHVLWQPVRTAATFAPLVGLSDAVVVTTITDGTSVTVLEAMQAAVPVVSSLTNGSAEWVMNGVTGWTFPVGDAEALADAVERMLNADPARRSLIVNNAQRLVGQRAGWDHLASRLRAELTRLIES